MGKPKVKYIVTDELCDYCKEEKAIVEFGNGKRCCAENPANCKTVKNQNAKKQMGNTYHKGKAQISWNKGLTKLDNPSLAKPTLIGVKWGSGKTGHSKETREKISKSHSLRNDHRNLRSVRCEYNGVKLESSWELALAKNLDENKIVWIRPKSLIWIDDSGQKRRYYPDFYLPEYDVYLDPKNDYCQKLDKRKFELVIEQHGIKLYMLNKNQLNWEIIESEVLR